MQTLTYSHLRSQTQKYIFLETCARKSNLSSLQNKVNWETWVECHKIHSSPKSVCRYEFYVVAGMARECKVIWKGGRLINATLCDCFFDCASVFSKSVAELSFSFCYVLYLASGAMYHIYEIRRWARDVMANFPLFISTEEGVKRGSLCNKRTCFAPTFVTGESSWCLGGWSAVCGSD